MKIHEILEPGQKTPLSMDDNNQEIINEIKQECAGYIQEATKANGWLYRGMSKRTMLVSPDLAFHGSSRTNREPKDSHPAAQKIFDYALDRLGFRALRSNSIFCTGSIDQAMAYGNAYVIFPVDGKSAFTYTRDSDIVLDDISSTHAFDITKYQSWHRQFEANVREHVVKARANSIINDIRMDLHDPIKTINDVNSMFDELQEQGVDLLDIQIGDFLNFAEFQKYFQPQSTNLATAIQKNVEVLIAGEYYALDCRKYNDIIMQAFHVEVRL